MANTANTANTADTANNPPQRLIADGRRTPSGPRNRFLWKTLMIKKIPWCKKQSEIPGTPPFPSAGENVAPRAYPRGRLIILKWPISFARIVDLYLAEKQIPALPWRWSGRRVRAQQWRRCGPSWVSCCRVRASASRVSAMRPCSSGAWCGCQSQSHTAQTRGSKSTSLRARISVRDDDDRFSMKRPLEKQI